MSAPASGSSTSACASTSTSTSASATQHFFLPSAWWFDTQKMLTLSMQTGYRFVIEEGPYGLLQQLAGGAARELSAARYLSVPLPATMYPHILGCVITTDIRVISHMREAWIAVYNATYGAAPFGAYGAVPYSAAAAAATVGAVPYGAAPYMQPPPPSVAVAASAVAPAASAAAANSPLNIVDVLAAGINRAMASGSLSPSTITSMVASLAASMAVPPRPAIAASTAAPTATKATAPLPPLATTTAAATRGRGRPRKCVAVNPNVPPCGSPAATAATATTTMASSFPEESATSAAADTTTATAATTTMACSFPEESAATFAAAAAPAAAEDESWPEVGALFEEAETMIKAGTKRGREDAPQPAAAAKEPAAKEPAAKEPAAKEPRPSATKWLRGGVYFSTQAAAGGGGGDAGAAAVEDIVEEAAEETAPTRPKRAAVASARASSAAALAPLKGFSAANTVVFVGDKALLTLPIAAVAAPLRVALNAPNAMFMPLEELRCSILEGGHRSAALHGAVHETFLAAAFDYSTFSGVMAPTAAFVSVRALKQPIVHLKLLGIAGDRNGKSLRAAADDNASLMALMPPVVHYASRRASAATGEVTLAFRQAAIAPRQAFRMNNGDAIYDPKTGRFYFLRLAGAEGIHPLCKLSVAGGAPPDTAIAANLSYDNLADLWKSFGL